MFAAIGIVILLVMVFLVIASIAGSGWKMSKGLGYTMFALYFVFVIQEVIRQYS